MWFQPKKYLNCFWICSRQSELCEDSPGSSEYSTGSTLLPQLFGDNSEHSLHQDVGTEMNSIQIGDQKGVNVCEKEVLSTETVNQGKIILPYEEQLKYFL